MRHTAVAGGTVQVETVAARGGSRWCGRTRRPPAGGGAALWSGWSFQRYANYNYHNHLSTVQFI